jgi:hypothetical protein
MPTTTADDIMMRLQSGAAAAADLTRWLGISQASVSRLSSRLIRQNRVLRMGSTKGARYALRREVRAIGSQWPIYLINASGEPQEIGNLHALAANQFYFETSQTAQASRKALGGLTDGIPYFLQDQRPAGFLGRHVPTLYPELQLPQRVADWTDDHYLVYLTQRGSDTVSNLVVGAAALDRYLANPAAPAPIESKQRLAHYSTLAQRTMVGGLPGSSAHGENPKFAAFAETETGPRQVLVKFSPARTTAVGQRWSDLLIAEHHAHLLLESADMGSCRSQLLMDAEQTFLEVERFDRIGARGRVGVTSLHAIDLCFYGQLDSWTAACERLLADRRIEAQDLARVRFLSTFGELIANTDRHFGNLAFYDNYDGRFTLAPNYDMLPMLFAPEHGQIVGRSFEAPLPKAQSLPVWPAAHALAQRYWDEIAQDQRVSEEFRGIAAQCLRALGD